MEELKLIVDMIQSLGGEAKQAFIWYLVITKGLHFIALMTLFGVLAYIAHRIINAVRDNTDTALAFRAIVDAYNANQPLSRKMSRYTAQWSRDDVARLSDAVTRGMQQ